jgi:hypothetical protein
MDNIKCINIKEFREKGYLQELNRQFLHPLGMALEINIDEDGNEILHGIWDYRDEKEGMLYADEVVNTKKFKSNIEFVRQQWNIKRRFREEKHGFMIQE